MNLPGSLTPLVDLFSSLPVLSCITGAVWFLVLAYVVWGSLRSPLAVLETPPQAKTGVDSESGNDPEQEYL